MNSFREVQRIEIRSFLPLLFFPTRALKKGSYPSLLRVTRGAGKIRESRRLTGARWKEKETIERTHGGGPALFLP